MNFNQVKAGLLAQGVDEATATLFLVWLYDHQQLWKNFEARALAKIAGGAQHGGAKRILEDIRDDEGVRRCCEFKINNNFGSCLARLFAFRHPEHRGFFEFREMTGLKRAA